MNLTLTPSALRAIAADPAAYENLFTWEASGEQAEIEDWAARMEDAAPMATLALRSSGLSDAGSRAFSEGFQAEAAKLGWYDAEADAAHSRPLAAAPRWMAKSIWFHPARLTPAEMGAELARILEDVSPETRMTLQASRA